MLFVRTHTHTQSIPQYNANKNSISPEKKTFFFGKRSFEYYVWPEAL